MNTVTQSRTNLEAMEVMATNIEKHPNSTLETVLDDGPGYGIELDGMALPHLPGYGLRLSSLHRSRRNILHYEANHDFPWYSNPNASLIVIALGFAGLKHSVVQEWAHFATKYDTIRCFVQSYDHATGTIEGRFLHRDETCCVQELEEVVAAGLLNSS